MSSPYVEVVAFPCGGMRYSMLLGIRASGKQAFFRAFRGSGLWRALRGGVSDLLLLYPCDPETYIDSFEHKLEKRLEWSYCPVPDHRLGAWATCTGALRLHAWPEADYYVCTLSRLSGGCPWGYSRVLGCTIELLVLISKLRAGIRYPGDPRSVARYLIECIRRSGGRERGPRIIARLMPHLQSVLGGV